MHDLIGIPYRRGAQGPDAVDCWALVRLACQRVHGVLPPLLAERVAPVARGAQRQGWRPAHGRARHGDVMIMRTATGQLHTGMVVAVRRRLELLHAVAGGSICQPLADLPMLGFGHFRTWRLQP